MSLLDQLRLFFSSITKRLAAAGAARKKEARRQKRLALARSYAADVDEMSDDLVSSQALAELNAFERGVQALSDPCFSGEELLSLSVDADSAIWKMGVVAVSRREAEPALVDRLLQFLRDESEDYFIMQALLVHGPLDRSAVGELVLSHLGHNVHWLPQVIAGVVPLVKERLDAGEVPSFGDHLNDMDREKAAKLSEGLEVWRKAGLTEMADTLQAELDRWGTTFVDRGLLQAVGRIWKTGSATAESLIEHPELLRQVQELLRPLRQTPRKSVLLTGEHGVGKTAVLRRAAQILMADDWLIFETAAADLTAGQRFYGDLEQRLKDLVGEIGGERQILWYVPDFQALAWAGTHQYSRSSILDLILPLLESGEIVLVGELPLAAYEQMALDKPRLVSACEVCRIAPLAEEGALALAAAWGERQGADFLSPAMLREAWLLSRQYLRDRESPGCLLEFLGRVRKLVLAENRQKTRIEREDLIDVLVASTSLPRQILDDEQQLDPNQLRTYFSQRIFGQPEAVNCLVERITLLKAGLTDPSQPQGVFLFAGPTGTGKTEIAKALASFLFGSEDRLLRYDMSEFQTPDSQQRLLGDGENLDRDSLAVRIRKQPFSVVLLDEFEKAHPRVWDLFLQVFDDGRLTDPLGRTSDFRHAIIILTSNLGGQAATGVGLGFAQAGEGFRAADVDRAVTRAFRPEFLNRLDRVVVFRPFTREIMRSILDKELHDVQQRRGLRNRQWDVVWEDSALEFLLDKGFSPTLGARPLKRAVERYLLTPLAETIVGGHYPAGDQFLYIQAAGDQLLIEFIDPEAGTEAQAEVNLEDSGEREPEATVSLAEIALNPRGTAKEFDDLTAHWQRLRDHLASTAWEEAKSLALSMTSLEDFWQSAERHAVLGEVEYRERVETGLDSVGRLVTRIGPAGSGRKNHYPRHLVGQAAMRLHLLDQACRSLVTHSPWEAFIRIEGKAEAGTAGIGVTAWVERLGGMYRQWAERRKMQCQVLQQIAGGPGRNPALLLAVSGYAAAATLAPETGLHIWEEPEPGRPRSTSQLRSLVRVVSLPAEQVAEAKEQLLELALVQLSETGQQVPPVVRTYREQPDPLVKDRSCGWRTGRLDRVLSGDFDLLRACAEHDAAAGTG